MNSVSLVIIIIIVILVVILLLYFLAPQPIPTPSLPLPPSFNRKGNGKIYSVFGAGPGGLYTIWNLLESDKLKSGDVINLYEWGNYQFNDEGDRMPAGRICTYYYNNDPNNSYIEIGGMRFIEWDGSADGAGQRLMTKTINLLGLNDRVVDFLTTDNPLYYLRGAHYYANDITSGKRKAPYNTSLNNLLPYDVYAQLSNKIIGPNYPATTDAQCEYYHDGKLNSNQFDVYKPNTTVSNIGYWNIFDELGNEAYLYAKDGGGYDSDVINWNSANAVIYNSEFATGGKFKTIQGGFSLIFYTMFQKIKTLANSKKIVFNYQPNTRLHSIYKYQGKIVYNLALASSPDKVNTTKTCDYVWLAMPPTCIQKIANATQYVQPSKDFDRFLNSQYYTYLLESVIPQPSYKIAMFFDRPWWNEATYKPDLINNGSKGNVYGPTITDLPIRQIYYFGDNSKSGSGIYGILAAYDDMTNDQFWRGLEVGDRRRVKPLSENLQPLHGGAKASDEMVLMLRKHLSLVHYGNDAELSSIPQPLETVYMDWGLGPFHAGYFAWRANIDIPRIMRDVRVPSENVFVTGSAFSLNEAWCEGAFQTASSVLDEYFGIRPIVDTTNYSLICQ